MYMDKTYITVSFHLPFALDSGTNDIIKIKKPKPIIELVVA